MPHMPLPRRRRRYPTRDRPTRDRQCLLCDSKSSLARLLGWRSSRVQRFAGRIVPPNRVAANAPINAQLPPSSLASSQPPASPHRTCFAPLQISHAAGKRQRLSARPIELPSKCQKLPWVSSNRRVQMKNLINWFKCLYIHQ